MCRTVLREDVFNYLLFLEFLLACRFKSLAEVYRNMAQPVQGNNMDLTSAEEAGDHPAGTAEGNGGGLDQQLYDGVIASLSTANPTIGWEAGGRCLEQAAQHMAQPATAAFLASCFSRIVSIFLDQKPGLLPEMHRRFVERAFHFGTVIATTQLADRDDTHLKVLASLLDVRKPYYISSPPGYRPTGDPEVRRALLRVFYEHGGVSALAKACVGLRSRGSAAWVTGRGGEGGGLGCDSVASLADAVVDIYRRDPRSGFMLAKELPGDLANRIANVFVEQVHSPYFIGLDDHKKPSRLSTLLLAEQPHIVDDKVIVPIHVYADCVLSPDVLASDCVCT